MPDWKLSCTPACEVFRIIRKVDVRWTDQRNEAGTRPLFRTNDENEN